MEGDDPNVVAGTALVRAVAELVADQLSNVVLHAEVDAAPVHALFDACIQTRKQQRLQANLRNDIRPEDVCDAWNSFVFRKEDHFSRQVPVAVADDCWVTFELYAEEISSLGAAVQAASRHGLLVELTDGSPGFGTLSQEPGPQTVIESFDCFFYIDGRREHLAITRDTWQCVRNAWSMDVRLTLRSSANVLLRENVPVLSKALSIGDGESDEDGKSDWSLCTECWLPTSQKTSQAHLPKNAAARDIAVIKKEECAEVVQQMWINEVGPALLDRLETRFREILQHACFFQCARPEGEVVILVVKSSIRENRLVKIKAGDENAREIFGNLREMCSKLDRSLEAFTKRIVEALFHSPGVYWDRDALRRLARIPEDIRDDPALPNPSDEWLLESPEYQAVLSLAGQPKGLLVLSSTGRIHMVGARLAGWTEPSSSAELAASQAANALFQSGEQCWNIVYSDPTKCGFYFKSHVGGPHIALRLIGRLGGARHLRHVQD